MPERVRAYSPATVANVCCAFDALGFALTAPGDEVVVQRSPTAGVTISKIAGDQGRLTKDPHKNAATIGIIALLAHLGEEIGISVELVKKMPLGSGMGSSAASAAAGVVAVNALLGSPLSKRELVRFAMESERVITGAAHADNVAPAILGGFVLVRSNDPLDLVEIPSPPELFCALVHPYYEVNTADARKILRRHVELGDAAAQWANVGALVAGLLRSDYDLISRSLIDRIIEPQRSVLIPGFDQAKAAALRDGALGFGLSGSGPSVFALARSFQSVSQIAEAINRAFQDVQIKSDVYLGPINSTGTVLSKEEPLP